MLVHRQTAPVVEHGGRAVLVQRNPDFIREAVAGLVNGVVNDLPKQVMQAPGGGGANVHARPHPNGLKAFQHLNAVGVVALRHSENSLGCGVTGRCLSANDDFTINRKESQGEHKYTFALCLPLDQQRISS